MDPDTGGIQAVLKRCRMGTSMIFRLSESEININFKKEIRSP